MGLPNNSKTTGKVYAKSMMDFDPRIKEEFKNDGQHWEINLGLSETANFPNANIKEGRLYVTNQELLEVFQPVVDRCVRLVNDQIKACSRKCPGKSITVRQYL